MKRLRGEKYSLQRHVKNADEDLKIALDTVDSKDDEATADDRYVWQGTSCHVMIRDGMA